MPNDIKGNGSPYGISQDVSPDMIAGTPWAPLVISVRLTNGPRVPSELKKSGANPVPNYHLRPEAEPVTSTDLRLLLGTILTVSYDSIDGGSTI